MVKRTISKEELENNPYIIWNNFIDLIAIEAENELTEIQKNAQRAFFYGSEIQNGGHLQYFENMGKKDFKDIINSIKKIGAVQQANVLEKASNQYLGKNIKKILSVLEYVKMAKEGEYEKYDKEYFNIKNDINYYLEKYLQNNIDEFIEIK